MEARRMAREQEKERLLNRLAEIQVEELREAGVFEETPRYAVLEEAGSNLGRRLSRLAQERAAREVRAECPETVACPVCGKPRPVRTQRRVVESLDGPVRLDEAAAYCPTCRRSFFPSAG